MNLTDKTKVRHSKSSVAAENIFHKEETKMLNYSIRLVTVNDFRNYANMLSGFHIGGYVQLEDKKVHIGSYLEILCHCPLYHVSMVLDQYRDEEVPELESYMKRTGLIERTAA